MDIPSTDVRPRSRGILGLVVSLRVPLAILAAIGLGVLLGRGLAGVSRSFVVSIVATILYTIVIFQSPVVGWILWVDTFPLIELYVNIPMGAGIPDLSLNRFCAMLLGLIFAHQSTVGRLGKIVISRLDKLALLSILGMLISVPFAVDPVRAAQTILDLYVIPVWVYFLARHLVSSRKTLQMVLNAFVIAGAFAGLYAIYYQVTGNVLFASGAYNEANLYYTQSLRQLAGLLGGPANFGLVFSMIIPINIYLLLRSHLLRHKVAYWVTLSVLVAGIFLSYRRTSWIALIVAFLILQWFYPRFRRLFLASLVVFGFVLFFTWDSVSESAVVTERIGEKVESANARVPIWNTMFNMWKSRPFFGFGYDQYKLLSGSYRTDGSTVPFKTTQSEYYLILVSAGLAGLVPYALMILGIVRDSIRVFRRTSYRLVDRQLVVIFWGVLAAYLIGGVTVAYNNAYPKMIFFAMVGLVAGQAAKLNGAKGAPSTQPGEQIV
jgi:O-antigen ligase